MSKKNNNVYLEDIILSVKKINKYVKGLDFSDFKKDEKTIDAVIRNLGIIGEAANNISSELKIKKPEIPWKEMVSIRNKIIHEYFGVDIDILWKTIQEDLNPLKKEIRKCIKS